MKNRVLFGPAGSPVDYKGAAYKAPKYINEEGLESYEYQSPYGVRIGEKAATTLKEESQKHDVLVSMHAPYYINLCAKEEEKIDFSNNSKDIHNQIRGLSSIPGAYCLMDDKRLKVYQVEVIDKKHSDGLCGEIVDVTDDAMIVRCGDGFIKILDIALEGKKRCKVKEYFNGIKKNSLVGKVLK